MTIRSYDSQDADRVIRIWSEASILAHHFIPAMYWIGKQDDVRNVYLPASNTYVYEDERSGKQIQGFVSMMGHYLAALFVIPELQGTGIGKALLEHVKSMHDEITLKVFAKNEYAVSFYEKQGFQITGKQMDEETGEEEFVMKWTIC